MRNFNCACSNTVYFANTHCLSCQRQLGFISELGVLSSFDVSVEGLWYSTINNRVYRPCANYTHHHICNWMVDADDNNALCRSCRLTQVIPDLSRPNNLPLWFKMEQAKRRLLFTLMQLGLPIWDTIPGKPELRFQFLEDVTEDEFGQELTVKSTVMTGHNNGTITLNLKEAEDASRIMMRDKMNERYRTLVGHFRHESGHFYWDWLIRDSASLQSFRALFGDETLDYTQALARYYDQGPVSFWKDCWISAYASAHPWEDWAETWAHYLHIIDTLDTAAQYEVSVSGLPFAFPTSTSFEKIYADWCRLTTILNALNRSMGLDDAYPFVIPTPALKKLEYVHSLIQQNAISFPIQTGAGG
ncbi:zinc-binding metallopeptidase family protein [Alteromonas sp. CYL-A6]|uniref:zinc-binding metallopeptidase family protein n=1 Tax=Alteromonas nitratireducens TaxID=3390813 RepID=UPI0034B6F58A